MYTTESGMLLIHIVGASSQFELASRLEDLIHLLPWVREIELVLVGFKWVHQYPPTNQQYTAANQQSTAASQQPAAVAQQQQSVVAKEPVEETELIEPIEILETDGDVDLAALVDSVAADSVPTSTGEQYNIV
jgi:hypothetical protein